jgi:chromosome partitioning protein
VETLGVLKQKGGAGATTIAVHLAVAAAEAGRRVVILDVDPQRSACSWGTARGEDEPRVVGLDVARLALAIEAAKRDGYDLVIVDTPPHSSAATAAVARASQLALVPLRPSALDLAAVPATVQIIRATGVPAVFVLNACPPRVREVDETRAFLQRRGELPLWEGTIGDRTVFRRAIASGRSVTEVDGSSKAADEIRDLWRHVRGLLQARSPRGRRTA